MLFNLLDTGLRQYDGQLFYCILNTVITILAVPLNVLDTGLRRNDDRNFTASLLCSFLYSFTGFCRDGTLNRVRSSRRMALRRRPQTQPVSSGVTLYGVKSLMLP